MYICVSFEMRKWAVELETWRGNPFELESCVEL